MTKDQGLQSGMRVAFYVRVSTEEQVERYGIPLQVESLKALVKSRGKLSDGSDALIFAGENHVYIDEGVSGTTPVDERPAFARLKEDIINSPAGNKPFDVVAVFKIDRFARRLKILLDIIDLFDDYDIKFISVNESIDTSTPFGKAMLGIIGVIAELELETIKARTQAGRDEAAKRGKAMGPSSPFGYTKNSEGYLVIHEKEAQVVKMIFEMFVEEKQTTQEIATWLTEHKYLSPAASAAFYGKRKSPRKKNANEFWRAEAVATTLKDERYIGNNYYGRYVKRGKERPRSEWKLSERPLPLIINPLTFAKAQKLLAAQKHTRAVAKDDHVYLLSGLLKCGSCFDRQRDASEAHWIGWRRELHRGRKDFIHYYLCGRKNTAKSDVHCAALPLPAKEVEEFILEESVKFLSNPEAVYTYQQNLLSTRKEITALEKKQKHLTNLLNAIPGKKEIFRQQHVEGIIDMEKLKREKAGADQEEERIRVELDEVERQIAQGAISASYLQAIDLFAKKYKGVMQDFKNDREGAAELLHALIDEIIVDSRPVKEDDVIAGKRKANQKIPHELYVRLKLPFEMINLTLHPGMEGSHQNRLNGAR